MHINSAVMCRVRKMPLKYTALLLVSLKTGPFLTFFISSMQVADSESQIISLA